MSCRRVQTLLSAYADYELTGVEMLTIRDHLAACEQCDAEYQSIASLKRLLASLPSSNPQSRLSNSLEGLSECNALSVALFTQKRLLKRALGMASPEENIRAMQQASGHAAGLACALGVLGAWFVVAPVALAPVASHMQERHPRLVRLLRAAGWARAEASQPSRSVFDLDADNIGYLNQANFRVRETPVESVPLTNVSFQPPVMLPQNGYFRPESLQPSFADNDYSQVRATKASLYSVEFNASR